MRRVPFLFRLTVTRERSAVSSVLLQTNSKRCPTSRRNPNHEFSNHSPASGVCWRLCWPSCAACPGRSGLGCRKHSRSGPESIPWIWWLGPIGSIVALAFAYYFYRSVMSVEEGTPRMIEIAEAVREGAGAYLTRQYRVVGVAFVILFIVFAILAYGFNVQSKIVPFAFLTGGFFSALCGFFGMKTATNASARTTNAARKSLNDGLAHGLPSRRGDGSGRGRLCPAGHYRLVLGPLLSLPGLNFFGSGSPATPDHRDHAQLRHGCLHPGPLRPCGRRHLHQGG